MFFYQPLFNLWIYGAILWYVFRDLTKLNCTIELKFHNSLNQLSAYPKNVM